MRVLSTLGVKGVLDEVGADFEREHGIKLECDFNPTTVMLERIRNGERADVTFLTSDGIDLLTDIGKLAAGSRVDLARSKVGLAVIAGGHKPDISTVDRFKAALLATPSIVYSKTGASGIFFAGLIQRLGLADAVNRKAIIVDAGFTAEPVARGEAELAFQQMSELMAVPGVELVGAIPAELQPNVIFSGGVFKETREAGNARALLAFLSGAKAADVYRRRGLDPVHGA